MSVLKNLKTKNHFKMIGNYTIVIGIDTGTNTGFAVWNKPARRFEVIETLLIHQAMDKVLDYFKIYGDKLFVRFEDARLRTWFQDKSVQQLQGAGSIKRDCNIWDDFLKDHKITYASIAPRSNLTKLTAPVFKQVTGWDKKNDHHARDAAMLVYGY